MVSMLDSRLKGPGSSPARSLYCALGQDTLLSQCLSPPGNLMKCWVVTCDGLAPHPWGVAKFTPSRFILRKPE